MFLCEEKGAMSYAEATMRKSKGSAKNKAHLARGGSRRASKKCRRGRRSAGQRLGARSCDSPMSPLAAAARGQTRLERGVAGRDRRLLRVEARLNAR